LQTHRIRGLVALARRAHVADRRKHRVFYRVLVFFRCGVQDTQGRQWWPSDREGKECMIEDVRERNPLNGILNSACPEIRRLTNIIMESIKSLAAREICFGILYAPDFTRERISSSLRPFNEIQRAERGYHERRIPT
jgi:hypothetical protein